MTPPPIQNNFHALYLHLCNNLQMVPLQEIKCHADNNCLDFYAERIKYDSWGPILNALSLDKTLHYIAIRNKHPAKDILEDVDTEKKTLEFHKKRPVIFTKFMMDLVIRAVTECLYVSPCLASLEFEGLPLKFYYVSELNIGVKHCHSLQNISFHGCSIGDEGCNVLCQSIKNLPNIIILNFTKCDITKEGAHYVAELIDYQRIQRLSESWKHSLRYRLPNVDSMSGLRRITLNDNVKIGKDGIIRILEVLKDDYWVKAVDFQDCGADNDVAEATLKLLNVNKILHIVDLRNNKLVDREHLIRVMNSLHCNNRDIKVEFDWIMIQKKSVSKKTYTQIIGEIAAAQTLAKESYRIKPKISKSAPIKPASKSFSLDSLIRRSETTANKTAVTRKLNFLNSYLISNEKLEQMLQPVQKQRINIDTTTTSCILKQKGPQPPPPTPESSSLHDVSFLNDIQGQELEMSKEEMWYIVKEMAREREHTFQEIAKLTAENRKLQDDLEKYREEIEQMRLDMEGKVLVEKSVMDSLQDVFETVYETRSSETASSSNRDTELQNEILVEDTESVRNFVTRKSFSSPCNNYKIPFSNKISKSESVFENAHLNKPVFIDKCGDAPEYVPVISHKKEFGQKNSDRREADINKLNNKPKDFNKTKEMGDGAADINSCDTDASEDSPYYITQQDHVMEVPRETTNRKIELVFKDSKETITPQTCNYNSKKGLIASDSESYSSTNDTPPGSSAASNTRSSHLSSVSGSANPLKSSSSLSSYSKYNY